MSVLVTGSQHRVLFTASSLARAWSKGSGSGRSDPLCLASFLSLLLQLLEYVASTISMKYGRGQKYSSFLLSDLIIYAWSWCCLFIFFVSFKCLIGNFKCTCDPTAFEVSCIQFKKVYFPALFAARTPQPIGQ